MAEHLVNLYFGDLDTHKEHIRLKAQYKDNTYIESIFDQKFTPEEAIQMAVKIFEVAVKILSKEELEDIKHDIKRRD